VPLVLEVVDELGDTRIPLDVEVLGPGFWWWRTGRPYRPTGTRPP
jgi:hypothetical protein